MFWTSSCIVKIQCVTFSFQDIIGRYVAHLYSLSAIRGPHPFFCLVNLLIKSPSTQSDMQLLCTISVSILMSIPLGRNFSGLAGFLHIAN